MSVRFLNRWRIYNPEDIAGFDPETESTLINSGIAERYTVDNPLEDKMIRRESKRVIRK